VLKTRILTALVFGPVLLAAVLLLPAAWFAIFMSAALVIGGWEYTALCGFSSLRVRWPLTLLYGLAIAASAWALYRQGIAPEARLLLLALAGIWMIGFSRLRAGPNQDYGQAWQLSGVLFSLAMLAGTWFALIWLRYQPNGNWWILTLLLTIWVADVGAYFSGRTLGKHKLAPAISPGKTWEGVAGALILSPLIVVGLSWWLPLGEVNRLALLALCLFTVMVSVGGDLYVSLHKRSVGLKDSGNLFPGHGGFLDRFDSLLAGAAFFALGKILFHL